MCNFEITISTNVLTNITKLCIIAYVIKGQRKQLRKLAQQSWGVQGFKEYKSLWDLNKFHRPNQDLGCHLSGDDGVEETLLSIPNRKVKLYSAKSTARATVWEGRTLPG